MNNICHHNHFTAVDKGLKECVYAFNYGNVDATFFFEGINNFFSKIKKR